MKLKIVRTMEYEVVAQFDGTNGEEIVALFEEHGMFAYEWVSGGETPAIGYGIKKEAMWGKMYPTDFVVKSDSDDGGPLTAACDPRSERGQRMFPEWEVVSLE